MHDSTTSQAPINNADLSTTASSKFRSAFDANQVIGPSVYHFGIVDFLQDWTFEKEMERNFKIYVSRQDPDGISVMPPMEYKLRFQNKMDQIFEMDDDPLQSGSSANLEDSREQGDPEDADESAAILRRESVRNPMLSDYKGDNAMQV